jgi:cation transport ATPase
MKKYLLTIVLIFGLAAAVSADTIRVTVNGTVCVLCATGIEKTFKAQPEVKTVDVDLENKLVTIQTKQGKTLEDEKSRSCSATRATPSSLSRDRDNERANCYFGDPDNPQLL